MRCMACDRLANIRFKLSGVVAPKALPMGASSASADGAKGEKVDTNQKLPSRRKP